MQPVSDAQLVLLQPPDALLVGRDHARHAGLDDTVEQLGDLPLDLRELFLETEAVLLDLRQAAVPQLPEHRGGQTQEFLGRLDRAQQCLELRLDLLPADRLRLAGAALGAAEIIGVAAVAALRPVSGERGPAIGAEHIAAQHEILFDVRLARREREALAVEPVLDALESRVAYQAFMLAGPPGDVPARRFHMARVKRLAEKDAHPLVGDPAAPAFGKDRMLLQEAHHVGLGPEAARGVAFERFLDDGGHRLVALEHVAAAGDALVFVPHGGLEDGVSVHDTRLHAMEGLFAVLAALVLRARRQDVLHELGVAVLAELEGEAFEHTPSDRDRVLETVVNDDAAGQAGEVVNDHDRAGRMLAQESDHPLDRGPVEQRA